MALSKKVFILIFFVGIFFAQSLFAKAFAQDLPMEASCNSAIPIYSPNIYKVDTTQTSATIFFTEQKDTITSYTISFGLTQDATGYTNNFVEPSKDGNLIFTLNSLLPDATYYFKVRSENGCAHGPWSAIRASGYPNSKTPRLPTTAGDSNYLLWIGLVGIMCASMGGIVLLF